MTVKLDERIARSFNQLRGEQFSPLMDYLKAVRTETLETLSVATDEKTLYRAQGKAIFLKDLIDNVDNAEILIGKLKR